MALALCLCLGLLPVSALAADAPLTEPLSFKSSTADTSGDGYSWDKATCTLTLDGLNLQTSNEEWALDLGSNTTIVLVDNSVNTITNSSTGKFYGIKCAGNLTIKGSGTLNVVTQTPEDSMPYDIYALNLSKSLVVEEGVTLNVTASKAEYSSRGIYLGGSLFLNGGTVTAVGGESTKTDFHRTNISVGVYSYGTSSRIIVSGGSLTATGTTVQNGNSYGVYGEDGIIADAGRVTASGETQALAWGSDSDPFAKPDSSDYSDFKAGDDADTAVTVESYTNEPYVSFTASSNHRHTLCVNTNSHGKDTCSHAEETWIAWNQSDALPTGGNYFLATDVTLTSSSKAHINDATLNLCLNGHSITYTTDDWNGSDNANGPINVNQGGTLNLSDCQAGSVTYRFREDGMLWVKDEAGPFVVNSGYITGKPNAGFVHVNGGTFNLWNGALINNTNGTSTDAKGLNLEKGTANLYGGQLSGNNDTGIKATGGNLNLYGAVISDNYVNGAQIGKPGSTDRVTVLLADKTVIRDNDRGGIRLYGYVDFTMTGGSITGNDASTASLYCGGDNTITITGGEITGNIHDPGSSHDSSSGAGGIQLKDDDVLTISGDALFSGNHDEDGTTACDLNFYNYDSSFEPVRIAGPLAKPASPAAVYANKPKYLQTSAFTSGWATHMADAEISDYFVSYDPTYTIAKNASGELVFAINHTHNWTYAANGATITATCGSANCTATDTSLTISAPALTTVGGAESAAATLSASTLAGASVSASSIKYAQKSGESWSDLNAAPTGVGNYKASITVGGATASAEYTISKAASSVTTPPAGVKDMVYSQTAKTLITAGVASGGTMQYSLDGTSWSEDLPTGTDAGTYTVWYKVVGDADHADTAPASVSAVIAQADAGTMGSIEVMDITGSSAAVRVAEADWAKALEYSIDGGNTWKAVSVSDGKFTVTGLTKATEYTIQVREQESKNYKASASVSDTFTTLNVTTVLVTYDGNGDGDSVTGVPAAQSKTFDGTGGAYFTIASPESMTREGYTFLKWNNKKEYPSGDPYKVGHDTWIQSDITLYAIWGKNVLEVTAPDGTTTRYPTLSMAFEKAPSGSTIKVLESYTDVEGMAGLFVESEDPAQHKTLTLDLNGKTVEAFLSLGNGSLTLKDEAGGGRLSGYIQQRGGRLTVEGGTYGGLMTYAYSTVDDHTPTALSQLSLKGGTFLGADMLGDGANYGILVLSDAGEDEAEAFLTGAVADGKRLDREIMLKSESAGEEESYYYAYAEGPVHIFDQGEHVITGDVEDSSHTPAAGVAVALKQGGKTIAETTTDAEGKYTFYAPAGFYNIVATQGDKIMTVLIEVKTGDLAVDTITLPGDDVNSELVISGTTTPAVVVGGLERVAQAVKDESAATSVTVTMTVESRTEDTAENADAIKAAAPGKTLNYLDIKIEKKLDNGDPQAISDTGNTVMEIVVPFDFAGKRTDSVTVYRYHGTQAEALTASDTRAGGTFRLDVANGRIHIYASKFSTYAIGYTASSTSSDGSGTITHAIAVKSVEHGTVKTSHIRASSGQIIAVTPTPDEGYAPVCVTVTDSLGNELKLTRQDDGSYTFTMPARSVTVAVVFALESDYTTCPRDSSCPMADYVDADPHAWYHDGIHFCLEHGLMHGYGEGRFAPDDTLTRAMLVQILYNKEGNPAVSDAFTFQDVLQHTWYADAVRWASASGVVTGYSAEAFGPEDAITREQLATMLWRYAGKPAEDAEITFLDADQISAWALDAMRWAVREGIMEGKGNGILDPTGRATRAETAQMLKNFMEK
ncbi:S-layer homology domain-containing protein [Feifania hominis]|uniref:S-layer homology domain-containing protein n=1 Tax=Feifania hominis TaxID=2763660 RepID=UPI0020169E3E|nr:S-layer homology domain-containing protein [Feifania hominis]